MLHKHGELLYEGVSAVVKDHLTLCLERVVAAPSELLLRELETLWNDHKHDMKMISEVLMYMDRTYVASQRKLLIYDQGTAIFRETVLRHPAIRDRVRVRRAEVCSLCCLSWPLAPATRVALGCECCVCCSVSPRAPC